MKRFLHFLARVAVIAAVVLIILDSKVAVAGAVEGVQLCITAVIPSLFPFIFLSMLTTGKMMGAKIRIIAPIANLCRIPKNAESLLIMAALGGYPVGAQAVHQAYSDKILNRNTARRLLGFCNNAGPSFVFGLLERCLQIK